MVAYYLFYLIADSQDPETFRFGNLPKITISFIPVSSPLAQKHTNHFLRKICSLCWNYPLIHRSYCTIHKGIMAIPLRRGSQFTMPQKVMKSVMHLDFRKIIAPGLSQKALNQPTVYGT
jgi:hypothetical protein